MTYRLDYVTIPRTSTGRTTNVLIELPSPYIQLRVYREVTKPPYRT